MKRFYKFTAIILAAISALALSACGTTGGSDKVEEVDPTKSQLYVYNYDGGIGTEWLYQAEQRFEDLYKDVSFEEGKTGVQVRVEKGKSNLDGIANSPYNVFFTEQVVYNSLIANNYLLDISDIVKSSLSSVEGCTETGTIEGKLSEEQRKAITAVDGKYYVLPHYECYTGVTYDRDLFNKKNLFIKNGGGYTNLKGDLSVGPDGIKGTYDDGLPSSYEEFYKLMSRMLSYNVTPFIYSGMYSTYTNNLVTGLWTAYEGKDSFMLNVNFGSGSEANGVKANVVTGFNGDDPIIESKTISPSTGYLLSQSAGKYYALSFLETVMGNSRYLSDKITEVLSHLDAQTEYIYSSLENKPIAMIIEGSYWYNEAKESLKASANEYPEDGVNRNFAFMPLPRQITGQVTEGNGTKNTLFDSLSSWAFINANIKNDPVKVKLAKEFLKFCYTDASLRQFTEETAIFKAVDYDWDNLANGNLSNYAKSIFDIRKNSDVIHPYSDNRIFINNQSAFNFCATSEYWSSVIGSTAYAYPYSAFKEHKSAKDYFTGMSISESKWNEMYGKYFN